MTVSAIGSLVMVGLNTSTPSIFWKGSVIPNIIHIRINWETDDIHIKLKVSAISPELHQELTDAGILVKVGG